jgi:hypothetical protein
MLRANEVLNEQEERKYARMAAMRPVMAQIEMKIRQQAMEFLMAELLRAGYWVWNVDEKYLFISWLKPIKSRDMGRPILTTNYRPSVYDPTFLGHQ